MFPTEFPQQALTELIGALSGGSQVSNRELVEDAYDLEGYALSMVFAPDAPPQAAMASLPKNLDRLQALQGVKATAGMGVNWMQVLLITIELIKQFLSAP